jgi:hypothetical protein
VGEVDIGILEKIKGEKKNIGEDASLQLGKNATDPTFSKSTPFSGDLLAEESQIGQEKLMLDRQEEFTRSIQ